MPLPLASAVLDPKRASNASWVESFLVGRGDHRSASAQCPAKNRPVSRRRERLTARERESLDRDGYVLVPALLDEPLMAGCETGPHPDEVKIVAPAGSFILFNAADTWHSGTFNYSPGRALRSPRTSTHAAPRDEVTPAGYSRGLGHPCRVARMRRADRQWNS
jgi:hypothetical protein